MAMNRGDSKAKAVASLSLQLSLQETITAGKPEFPIPVALDQVHLI